MKSVLGRIERAERLLKQTALVADVSFIWETMDGWRLDFGLWDGKPGGGQTLTTFHSSIEEATAEYDNQVSRHQRNADAVLILIDV